jgi:hypothetical protein
VFFLAATGASYDGEIALTNIPVNFSGFFSGDQATFVRRIKMSCTDAQRKSQSGTNEQQVQSFCQCFAEGLLNELTVRELSALMSTTSADVPPQITQPKIDKAAAPCRRSALGR